jgi:uncharacterized protein YkwD
LVIFLKLSTELFLLKKIYSYCLFFLISFCSCKKETVNIIDKDETTSLLTAINKLRLTGCLCGTDSMPAAKPLVANIILTITALHYASDMNSRNFFSHMSPEGTSPIQRAMQNGYTGTYVGEILGRNYSSVNAVMAAWKSSPEHCRAMMDSIYTEMGAGKSGNYWVVNLGKK